MRSVAMSIISGGTLAGVITFALIAGLVIGLFMGYMVWGLRLFGCRFLC
jgi:hypothetical protein